MMLLLILMLASAIGVCAAEAAEADETVDEFALAIESLETLADDALERGMSLAQSVAELRHAAIGQTSFFSDMYAVVFRRRELAQRDEI